MPLWMWCLYILDFPGQPWVVNILSCCSHKYNHTCQAMCHEFWFGKYGRRMSIRARFSGLMPYAIAPPGPTPSPLPILTKGLFLF